MKLFHHYTVYILQCNDGTYYTGLTNDLERRIWEHESGYIKNCHTFKKRPLKLVYAETFEDVQQAIAWEKQIKCWTRKKKQALIEDDWESIVELAKNRTGVDTRFKKRF